LKVYPGSISPSGTFVEHLQAGATSSEVTELRRENSQLKQLVADLSLKNVVLKTNLAGLGEEGDER